MTEIGLKPIIAVKVWEQKVGIVGFIVGFKAVKVKMRLKLAKPFNF